MYVTRGQYTWGGLAASLTSSPPSHSRVQLQQGGISTVKPTLGVSRYTLLASPILYGIWHMKGGSGGGGHILRKSRSMVLQ